MTKKNRKWILREVRTFTNFSVQGLSKEYPLSICAFNLRKIFFMHFYHFWFTISIPVASSFILWDVKFFMTLKWWDSRTSLTVYRILLILILVRSLLVVCCQPSVAYPFFHSRCCHSMFVGIFVVDFIYNIVADLLQCGLWLFIYFFLLFFPRKV